MFCFFLFVLSCVVCSLFKKNLSYFFGGGILYLTDHCVTRSDFLGVKKKNTHMACNSLTTKQKLPKKKKIYQYQVQQMCWNAVE